MQSHSSQAEFGVNYFGPIATKDGIGRAGHLHVEALKSAKVPIDVFSLNRPVALQSVGIDKASKITDDLLNKAKYPINIFHFSSRWTHDYWQHVSASQRSNRYCIGYWMCEVPEIPEEWAKNLAYYHEIWTASAFCQNAIARVSTIPVISFPHPMEATIATPDRAYDDTRPLRFLSISNCYSDAERKNVLGTLRAFCAAFGDSGAVQLTLKLSNLQYAPRLEAALQRELASADNVMLETGYVTDDDIAALYSSHHVYVSLHRAEGYGLTISDALRYGMPVICTGYSGNMDFSYMPGVQRVDYDLRRIGHERLRYLSDHMWAYPKKESAVAAFRHMASHYEIERRAACASAKKLADRLSFASIGEMMRRRLDLIHRRFAYRDDMAGREVARDFDIYEA